MTETLKERKSRPTGFVIIFFEHSNLFRVSIFGFRI